MSELSLKAVSPLNGYHRDFIGISLTEIINKALVSIATPVGGEVKLASAIKKSFNIKMPEVGFSANSENEDAVFLGMQPDLMFVYFDHSADSADAFISQQLKNSGYYSDQTDSWVMVSLTGPMVRCALERICSLDLHPEAFPSGKVSRTVMEHLGVIIYRATPDKFILFSARSSARSFLHALEISIGNATEQVEK